MGFGAVMEWLPLEDNPVISILQGVVGACGVTLMCNLLRVSLFVLYTRHTPAGGASEIPDDKTRSIGHLSSGIQFILLAGVLSLVGPRVSSLMVLEFCLRAFLASLISGQGGLHEVTTQFLIQSQFSLGCALTCTLQFLHAGAPHRWLSLLLAAGLSWFLSRQAQRLWAHVGQLYPRHYTRRDCGVCLVLISSREALLPKLRRGVVMTFTMATVAATAVVFQHFLLGAEDLRFWIPMTLCYVLLLLRVLEDQQNSPGGEVLLRSAALRVGALFVWLLMVGNLTDVLQVLFCFLGEAVCLLPSLGLLRSSAAWGNDKDPNGPLSSE